MEKNPFDFLKRLPDASLSGTHPKSEGVLIDGAWCGVHAMANVLHGDKMPQQTWTIGIAGRGTLQMGETEARELLSAMLALFEYRSPGFNGGLAPTSPSTGLPVISSDITGQ